MGVRFVFRQSVAAAGRRSRGEGRGTVLRGVPMLVAEHCSGVRTAAERRLAEPDTQAFFRSGGRLASPTSREDMTLGRFLSQVGFAGRLLLELHRTTARECVTGVPSPGSSTLLAPPEAFSLWNLGKQSASAFGEPASRTPLPLVAGNTARAYWRGRSATPVRNWTVLGASRFRGGSASGGASSVLDPGGRGTLGLSRDVGPAGSQQAVPDARLDRHIPIRSSFPRPPPAQERSKFRRESSCLALFPGSPPPSPSPAANSPPPKRSPSPALRTDLPDRRSPPRKRSAG